MIYIYDPQPDITTHELAVLVTILAAGLTGVYRDVANNCPILEVTVPALPEGARRHFREVANG